VPEPAGPSVLVITGPPGSGKTTVAELLAACSQRSVHLESDAFFHFIKAGYLEPWRPESHEQNTAIMRIVSAAAASYAQAGYATIVDGIISPRWFLEPVRDGLRARGCSVAYAVLRAPLAVCLSRAGDRESGRQPSTAVVEQLWHEFADLGPLERHVVDTEKGTPEETASTLDESLRAGQLTM